MTLPSTAQEALVLIPWRKEEGEEDEEEEEEEEEEEGEESNAPICLFLWQCKHLDLYSRDLSRTGKWNKANL